MNLSDYIKARLQDEEEFDAIIGDVDMPATICLDSAMVFPTEYMTKKYGVLLESEVHILPSGVVEVLHEDYELGEQFCYSLAGYCSPIEYEALTGLPA